MSTAIVWFKTDLRLHDNETLVNAIKNHNEIIPVFCLNKNLFTPNEFSLKKMGVFKAQFLLQSLTNLNQNLKLKDSGLVVLQGNPEIEIVTIAKQYNVKKVYAKKEVAYEEIEEQLKVEKELWKINCSLEVFSTSTLYHPSDLPFAINNIPDVFTNFKTKVQKETSIRNCFETPTKINSPILPEFKLPLLNELGFDNYIKSNNNAYPFTGGESEALNRLNYYFFESKLVSNYKETRNQLTGADYSSKFSAWLALGCISPKKIFSELKKYENEFGNNDSTYWLYFELLWRDFFRFMMKKHKQKLFSYNGITNNKNQPNLIDKNVFEKWKTGNTGVDFVDANMKELNATGFMSNRGRQNVASYFVNDLKQDWRYGAAYFEQQLIDYDECSNWGNWAYIAGVGNDPRKDRYFNIEKQAQTYDTNFEYRKLWL